MCTLSLYTILASTRTNAQCRCLSYSRCTCPTLASHKLQFQFPAVLPTSAPQCGKLNSHFLSHMGSAMRCVLMAILPGAPRPQEVTCPLLPQLLCITTAMAQAAPDPLSFWNSGSSLLGSPPLFAHLTLLLQVHSDFSQLTDMPQHVGGHVWVHIYIG